MFIAKNLSAIHIKNIPKPILHTCLFHICFESFMQTHIA